MVFLGTIGTAMAGGAWTTSGQTTGGGGRVELGTGAGSGEVRGWMAIGDVAEAFDVPLPELPAAFELPADTPPSTALKDLESEVFTVSALRTWLASGSAPAP